MYFNDCMAVASQARQYVRMSVFGARRASAPEFGTRYTSSMDNRIWEWWKLSFSAIIHNLAQFLGWREGTTWHSFEPEEEEPFYLQDDHGRRQFKMTMKVDNGEEWLQIRALTPQAASVQNILGECAEYGPQGLARLDQLKAVIELLDDAIAHILEDDSESARRRLCCRW